MLLTSGMELPAMPVKYVVPSPLGPSNVQGPDEEVLTASCKPTAVLFKADPYHVTEFSCAPSGDLVSKVAESKVLVATYPLLPVCSLPTA